MFFHEVKFCISFSASPKLVLVLVFATDGVHWLLCWMLYSSFGQPPMPCYKSAENFIGKKIKTSAIETTLCMKTQKTACSFCISTQKCVSRCFIYRNNCLENFVNLVYHLFFGQNDFEDIFFTYIAIWANVFFFYFVFNNPFGVSVDLVLDRCFLQTCRFHLFLMPFYSHAYFCSAYFCLQSFLLFHRCPFSAPFVLFVEHMQASNMIT